MTVIDMIGLLYRGRMFGDDSGHDVVIGPKDLVLIAEF